MLVRRAVKPNRRPVVHQFEISLPRSAAKPYA